MRSRFLLVALLSLVGTLSTSPFCAGALMAQAQGQDPVMPPPGNPGNPEPPKGAYCDRSNRPAHHCACHAQCVTDDEGKVALQVDDHCRAYCHAKYCKCPADNCEAPASRP